MEAHRIDMNLLQTLTMYDIPFHLSTKVSIKSRTPLSLVGLHIWSIPKSRHVLRCLTQKKLNCNVVLSLLPCKQNELLASVCFWLFPETSCSHPTENPVAIQVIHSGPHSLHVHMNLPFLLFLQSFGKIQVGPQLHGPCSCRIGNWWVVCVCSTCEILRHQRLVHFLVNRPNGEGIKSG